MTTPSLHRSTRRPAAAASILSLPILLHISCILLTPTVLGFTSTTTTTTTTCLPRGRTSVSTRSSSSFYRTPNKQQSSFNKRILRQKHENHYYSYSAAASTWMLRQSAAEDASSAESSSSTPPPPSTTTAPPAEGRKPPFSVTLEEEDYSYKEAIVRTLGWVGASLLFGSILWTLAGPTTGEEFFAGYLVEQSLSVDNLFVFLLLFEYFKVPLQYQDRVLNWGIYGAILMRGLMIGLGTAALQHFHAILLVFAGILIYSSVQFFISGASGEEDDDEDPSHNSIIKLSHSLIDSTEKFDGKRFFTIEDGIRKATPLFICMIAVEISDVVFAVDSIPAVFGVTENPLVVFSSNLFAIMGLRSLYTILSKAATDLKYLEPAVAVVLGFIGSKMVGEYFGYEIPTSLALSVVASLLITGVGASVWEKQRALVVVDEDSSSS